MMPKRFIVDTTLRDGEQSPGYALCKENKLLIAGLLDDAGVYQIEAGIPAIGSFEKDAIIQMKAQAKNALISTWNRMHLDDIRHSLDCSPDIVHISVPVSYTQIYSKLRKNKTWIVNKACEAVNFALGGGAKEVTVGFEDASRADSSFLFSLAVTLRDLGVRRIRYADTVGVLTPSRAAVSVSELIANTGMDVEMHSHNDLGMAVANSLTAAKAGARYIDTTIMGIGERTGNCDMQKFVYVCEGLYSVGMNRLTALVIEDRCMGILAKRREEG